MGVTSSVFVSGSLLARGLTHQPMSNKTIALSEITESLILVSIPAMKPSQDLL